MYDETLTGRVRRNISEYNLLKPGFHVVAGVSGGADSVCLLKVLTELRDEFDLKITAVHINHMLRGAEADSDEEYVADLCKALNVSLRIFHEDIGKKSEENGISLEEAGRDARYSCFRRIISEEAGDVIAVAHNYEDQAETVMMNILRGCGIEGLAGMDFKTGTIIRPLLNIRRVQIIEYLAAKGLKFRTDSSNLSVDYTRNRMRNRLFPFIREEFAVDPACMLNRLSELSRKDDAYIENQARQVFLRECREQDGVVVISAPLVSKLDAAISGRVIRMAWERITGGRKAIESNHVDKIRMLCSGNNTGKSLSLPGGLTAWLSYESLMMGKREKQDAIQFSYRISIPGTIRVAEAGGTLTARILDRNDFGKESQGLAQIKENSKIQIFDYLKINCGINIRNRRDGDRFRPRGSAGGKKLKEFFIDRKVEAGRRDAIPLVASEQNILWVIGMRTSEDARVDQNTQTYLILDWSDD